MRKRCGLVASMVAGFLLVVAIPFVSYGAKNKEAKTGGGNRMGITGVPPAPLIAVRVASEGKASTYNFGPRFLRPFGSHNMSINLDTLLGLTYTTGTLGYSSGELYGFPSVQVTGRLRYDYAVYGNFQPYLYFGGVGLDVIFASLKYCAPDGAKDAKWSGLPEPVDLRVEFAGGGAEWQATKNSTFTTEVVLGYLLGLPEGRYDPQVDDYRNERLYDPSPYVQLMISLWRR